MPPLSPVEKAIREKSFFAARYASVASKLAFSLKNRRVLSLADQAVVSVANMCTTVIIGRICAKEQLGLYASGYSLALLATAVQTALISVPYTISMPQLPVGGKRIFKGSTFLQQLGFSAITTILFLWFGLRLGLSSQHYDLGVMLLMLAAVGGMICFRDFARRASYAELRFSFALVMDGIAAVVQLFGIALLAFTGNLTAARALAAVGLGAGTAGAVWVLNNRGGIDFSLTHAIADCKRNWALGRWLFASSVLWSLSIEQYPWVISTLRAPSEAAVWASCYGVMAFLNPIVLALNNDAAPRASNDFAQSGLLGLRRGVVRSCAIAVVITSPIVIVLLLFGGKIVTLMYGPRFSGQGMIVGLLATGFVLYATGLPLPYGMLTLKRPRVDFGINVICFLTFLAVGPWFVKSYGAGGAAYSFVTVQAIAFISRVIGFRHIVANEDRTRRS